MITFNEWQKKNEDLAKIKCFIAKTPVSYTEVKKKFDIDKDSYNRVLKEMGYNN